MVIAASIAAPSVCATCRKSRSTWTPGCGPTLSWNTGAAHFALVSASRAVSTASAPPVVDIVPW
ncbi:hypothetical protein [Amycolatopsis australiensis]|uniref:Uncharacterized protein n=1 Tax=Amycolatopsis australiensis TaxID=546364 RepID=A0A1K1QQ61_9PSEU|nr:hypothetical protein [Amycolatopsis australiensis]SFW62098.1 hypothetical protein SAMN04489730_2085 [Amycolatopsis australiensis]